MKLLINLVLLLLITQKINSQTLIAQAKPMGGKLWGYIDITGNLVIPAKYATCYEFTEDGFAAIYEAKQYHFINKKGEKIITELSGFKLIDGFGINLKGYNNGLAPVKIGTSWGYMDVQGKESIKPSYDKVSEFNGGYAVASRGEKKFVLDLKGNEIPVTDTKVFALKHFSEGLAPFDGQDKKNGFIDISGKVVIEPDFMSVGYFVNDLAWAKTTELTVGYINKKGEWVIKPQFTAAKDFDAQSGMARVKIAETWAYIDKTERF
ncbi:MAG: WG repeat-containing protein [Bacteroidetes bacterium]|nr:WG repeat-containing protein [Bacteroidota bacterium]HET6243793.1 WG repeat-containing protein [Bacteroidia bacterium]